MSTTAQGPYSFLQEQARGYIVSAKVCKGFGKSTKCKRVQ